MQNLCKAAKDLFCTAASKSAAAAADDDPSIDDKVDYVEFQGNVEHGTKRKMSNLILLQCNISGQWSPFLRGSGGGWDKNNNESKMMMVVMMMTMVELMIQSGESCVKAFCTDSLNPLQSLARLLIIDLLSIF